MLEALLVHRFGDDGRACGLAELLSERDHTSAMAAILEAPTLGALLDDARDGGSGRRA